jgi:hypothetical protein
MPKRHLEAATQGARARQRQKLGSLKQLTVQPATKRRYEKAIDGFLAFLNTNDMFLPKQRHKLDPLVCDYLEHLWATGQGRGLASDTVAGLQDHDIKLKGELAGAWRLLKTWSVNEIPNRAPPLPQHVVHAMVGWAFFHQRFSFGLPLLLGFYGMLRTGEILDLRASQLLCDKRNPKVILSLGLTKGGKRQGAAESAVIGYDLVVYFVHHWKQLALDSTGLATGPASWRALFNDALESLQLSHFGFRPYSLRRGGATWWFSRHHSMDKLLLQGRWQAPKTARIYINEGLSVLAEMSLPPSLPSLAPFLLVFNQQRTRLTLSSLEPPVGRTGGRGKGFSKSSKKGTSKKRGKRMVK